MAECPHGRAVSGGVDGAIRGCHRCALEEVEVCRGHVEALMEALPWAPKSVQERVVEGMRRISAGYRKVRCDQCGHFGHATARCPQLGG